ncbi:MAG: ABC transporter permease [Gemmatimonadota bacterium]|nr:ABC transporter permease [Gemmatimonadota bacterium]MDH5758020.1 ABC transporter permease [Gemmatimonadota bacterium]
MMNNVRAVVRREYLQRVRSKWFIFATVVAPLLMMGMVLLPIYFANRNAGAEQRLVLVDATGVLGEGLEFRLEDAGYEVEPRVWRSGLVEELLRDTLSGSFRSFMVVDEETLASGRALLYATSRPSVIRGVALRQAVVQTVLEHELEGRSADVGALLRGGDLDVRVPGRSDAGSREASFMAGFVGAFILYMVILLYAVAVMRSTLEEKTSRIAEVIVSAMPPWHLMLGKILGVGAVGLTQLLVWVVVGVLVSSAGLPAVVAAGSDGVSLEAISAALPSMQVVAFFLACFLLGYFIFAGLYAAVGAICNSDEEAQHAQLPVTILIIVPMILLGPTIENPHEPLFQALSLVPFFSPVLMFARVAGGAAVWWEIALSVCLMAVTVVAVAWVAGRIYRVGMLMSGKRPTLPELWRWVREA